MVLAEYQALCSGIRDMETLDQLSGVTNFVERLMKTTHAIVLFMDVEGRVVLFNDFMRDLSGYELEEVRGRDWFDTFIPERERERLKALYAQGIGGVEVARNVNPIVIRSGEERVIEWWANVVVDETGATIGLLSVGQDITEREAMRAEVAERERLASIGMMASVFAHEVGNPLNAMYLQAQLLRRRIDRPNRGPLAPKVDGLIHELQRLSKLLDEFRSFYRPTELLLSTTDLPALLAHVRALLEPLAEERGLRVEADIDANLPRLQANSAKLEQVVLNLCKNAMEAMKERGELLCIRARAREEGVTIEVQDEGKGIPEDLDVFAPFTTTKAQGMGLGLAVARDIVRAHGGELSYTSELGVGTTFTLVLPVS